MTLCNRQAFTLIELLIVVAIIGILAAIAVPNFLNAQTRAKVSRAVADLRSIGTALEMYRLDNNDYMLGPITLSAYMGDRIWQQLTTPISYLGGFLQDPFKPLPGGNVASEGKRYTPLGLYQYRNAKVDRQRGTQGDTHPDALWISRSLGPDRVLHPWGSRLYIGMAYKSSNGIQSAGDIVTSNLGILGENDQGQKGNI